MGLSKYRAVLDHVVACLANDLQVADHRVV